MELCFQLDKVAKIVRWKVKEGNNIYQGNVIFEYVECANGEAEEIQSAPSIKFKATKSGVISKILATKGSHIQKGTPLLALNPAEQCTHPIVMHDMCGVCSKDLRQLDDLQPSVASVAMVHSVPGLKVSMEEAQILGKLDEQHLLKERKLVLLVDLDQTLIHTTNDSVPHNLENVFHFQLNSHGSVWYHTRLRPGTHAFLEKMNSLFQLHICTFGTRQYANTIAKHLDPQCKFFSDRILSRDECFNPNSKTANLKELFPRGDHMVCIIDDREDVWSFATNLIHVKPYHFFRHTGDINAPPGLSKKDNDDKDGFEFPNNVNKVETVDESTDAISSVVSEKENEVVENTVVVEQISVDDENKVMENFEEAVNSDTISVMSDTDKNASSGTSDSILLNIESNNITGEECETIVESLVLDAEQSNYPKTNDTGEEAVIVSSKSPSDSDVIKVSKMEVPEGSVVSKEVSEMEAREVSSDHKVSEIECSEGPTNSAVTEVDAPTGCGDKKVSEVEDSNGSKVSEIAVMEVSGDMKGSEIEIQKSSGVITVSETETQDGTGEIKFSEMEAQVCSGDIKSSEMEMEVEEEKPTSVSDTLSESAASSTENVKVNANDAVKTDSSDSLNNSIPELPIEVPKQEPNILPVQGEISASSKPSKEIIQTKTDGVVKIEDPDDYLLYLEEILKSIHKAYYDLYDDMGLKGKTGVPDVKTVIPYVRRKVLKGTSIVFSGVIPTQIQLEKSRQYAVAVSLGAHVSSKIIPPPKPGSNIKPNEPPTTHVVAAREGTAKVNEARKRYKGIHIVTPDWLWSCAERWDRAEEKMFFLFKQTRFKRNPPAHCSSPEQTLKLVPDVECLTPIDDISPVPSSSSVAGPSSSKTNNPGIRKERTPSGRFMDTINPLLTFSMDEIESMDHEVDDIFNESDSSSSTEDEEGRAKKETSSPRRKKPKLTLPTAQPAQSYNLSTKISGRLEKDSSSNEEDTENENIGNADTLLGKRKRSPLRTETETEDEPLSTRFRRGEPLPSDLDTLNLLSESSDDDDGDKVNEEEDEWMAEALEREFLDENSQEAQN